MVKPVRQRKIERIKAMFKTNLTMKEEKYFLPEALITSQEVHALLAPYCFEIETLGSIRRLCPLVSDIDLILRVKPYTTGLFETDFPRIVGDWSFVKGELVYGVTKEATRILPNGMQIEMYFADEDNFGYLKTLRTGSKDFNKFVMLPALTRQNLVAEGGYITQDGHHCRVETEEKFFEMMGIKYVEPKDRNY